ncbi:hypothetical protein KI387_007557, partial [Taxus chinensis]
VEPADWEVDGSVVEVMEVVGMEDLGAVEVAEALVSEGIGEEEVAMAIEVLM